MKIAVDINQTIGSHGIANCDQHEQLKQYGADLELLPLPFADYCLVTDSMQEIIDKKCGKVHKNDFEQEIKIAIDMKGSLDEVAMNIQSKDHIRFRNELAYAQSKGCKLFILVCDEFIHRVDEVWKYQSKRKDSRTNFESLMKAMITMSRTYDCAWFFCKQQSIGRAILFILTGKDYGELTEDI